MTSTKFDEQQLHVEIMVAGDGNSYPVHGDSVSFHYSAFLSDGTKWDCSRERNKPFKFQLGAEQVIRGLEMGISQLSVGEKARITIPPKLAYGENGFPGLIPRNSSVIFDVEILSFS